jgi:hypothetical protein
MARDEPPGSGPPRRAVPSGSGAPPAPKRRRRDAGADAPKEAVAAAPAPPRRGKRGKAAEGTPVHSSTAAPQGRVTVEATSPAPARRGPRLGVGSHATSRPLRILAWVVALPIALVVVGIPARKAGYLTGQKLLDVIVEHDIGRFVPLLVIVALWALVTAVLVTLFLDGGHWLMERRARRHVAAEMAAPASRRRGRG